MRARRSPTIHPDTLAPIGLALLIGLAIVVALAPWGTDAAFPGQNGKIAFDDPLPGGVGNERQIFTINPDAGGLGALPTAPVNDTEPAWSANGQRIVFARFNATQGETEIWVINADGTGLTQLTHADATLADDRTKLADDDRSPAFSGDGTRVTFSRNDGNPEFDDEIWVMNADGTGETKLTSNTVGDTEPTFSPDSARIAFTRDAPPTGRAILTMQADGTPIAAMTPTDGSFDAEGPNFSPDGSRLVFARCPVLIEGCNDFEIFTMSSTTPLDPPMQITTPGGNDFDHDPVFSPDGTRVAFVRDDGATANVLTVAASGGVTQPVTSSGGAQNPDWQPIFSSSPSGGAAGKTRRQKKCRGVPVTIFSTNGPDVIKGTKKRDVVHGLRGSDRISGLKGNDRLCGGRGKDRISGDKGSDIIFGGHHADVINGGPKVDRIFGGTPAAPIKLIPDVCHGGQGADFFRNCQKGG